MTPQRIELRWRGQSEFRVGTNCREIKRTPEGWLIREPRIPSGETFVLYAFDVLLSDGVVLEIERSSRLECPVCGALARTAQGRTAHVRYHHPEHFKNENKKRVNRQNVQRTSGTG